jgi:hypothetical protein
MSWEQAGVTLVNDDAAGCSGSQSADGTAGQCVNLTSTTKTTWTAGMTARTAGFVCQVNWYPELNCTGPSGYTNFTPVWTSAGNGDCWAITRTTVTVPAGSEGSKSVKYWCFGKFDDAFFGP